MASKTAEEAVVATSTTELEAIAVKPSNLISNFKTINEATIRQSNACYVQYGAQYTVKNLAWFGDRILSTYKD